MLYFGYLALWWHSGCRRVFYFDCLFEGKWWMSSFLTKRLLKECFLFISVSLRVLCGFMVLLFPQSIKMNLLLFWRLGWKRVVYVLPSVPSQLNAAVQKLNNFLSVFCSKIWLHWLLRTVRMKASYVSNHKLTWQQKCIFTTFNENRNHKLLFSFVAQTTLIHDLLELLK